MLAATIYVCPLWFSIILIHQKKTSTFPIPVALGSTFVPNWTSASCSVAVVTPKYTTDFLTYRILAPAEGIEPPTKRLHRSHSFPWGWTISSSAREAGRSRKEYCWDAHLLVSTPSGCCYSPIQFGSGLPCPERFRVPRIHPVFTCQLPDRAAC